MSMKKRFSVIFLILILICTVASFVACNDKEGESPIVGAVINVYPKTVYYLGDKFSLQDAQLTIMYEDGSTKVVPIDSTMVSDFDPNVLGEQTLTVKYEDITRYVTVTVKAAPVYALKVVSTNHKTEYVVGQTLDRKNLKLEVTYSNGYVSVLTDKDLTDDMFSGFDSATPADEKQVVVSYGQKTCSFGISVVPKSVVNRELTAPSKKDYYVGDVLDFKGGTMFVAYNDNSENKFDLKTLYDQGKIGVVIDDESTVEFTKSGTQKTVTVIYEGQRFPYSVNVYENTADKLLIKKKPQNQIMGATKFDFSDGVITVSYKNGTVEDVSFTDKRVSIDFSACDLNAVGDYNLSITVGGATITCEVKVIAPSPASLHVVRPEGEKIYQGKSIDFSQWKYYILLNNGKKEEKEGKSEFEVTESMLNGKTLSDFDFYEVGEIKLPFKIKAGDGTDLLTSVKVQILAKEIVSLTINNAGRYVYSENDVLSVENVTFFAEYNNGDKGEEKAVESGMLVDEDGNAIDIATYLSDAGTHGRTIKKIYVTYTDLSFDTQGRGYFEVLLVKKAKKIEFSGEIPKTKYVYGESFDSSDWQVKITYIDGSTGYFSGKNGDDFEGEEWKFSFIFNKGTSQESEENGFDKLGKYTVKLVYGEDENVYLTHDCDVTNYVVAVHSSKPFLGFVTEGTSPLLGGAYLLTIREDGTKENISLTENILGKFVAPTYVVNSGYASAYIQANGCAAIDSYGGLWQEKVSNYYVKNENGYKPARGEYSSDVTYFVNVAQYYQEVWENVYYKFYVKNGSEYRIADVNYAPSAEYFVANAKTITFSYEEHELQLPVFVAAKTITSVEISEINSEYDQNAKEWDYSSLRLVVGYDNGTRDGVTGAKEATGGDKLLKFDDNDKKYGFTASNGLRYTIEIGKNETNGFVPFDFETFKSAFDSQKDIFNRESISVRIYDAINFETTVSGDVSVYVFEQLIKEIRFYLGEMKNETFVAYFNQTVYVNEKKDVLKDGFGIKNDGTRTTNLKDNAYLSVVANNGNEAYYALSDNKLKSLQIAPHNEGSFSQSVNVSFALRNCSFNLQIRPNVIKSLYARIVTADGKLSVIEKTDIDDEDVAIYAEYKDADGNDIEGKTLHLGQTEIEGYTKTDVFEFDANGKFNTTINVCYGGLKSPLDLTVRRRTLERITVITLPSTTVYVETPFANPSESKKLDYTGGKVLITFDNGESEEKSISNKDIAKNEGAFNPNKELTGGAQETQEIILSYSYYGVTKTTSFNVIIKDRKYVSVSYDELLGYSKKLICEYGAEESIMPLPVIKYYEWFNSNEQTLMEKNSSEEDVVGKYNVRYRDSLGVVSSVWPKEVGTYTVIYSYFEDKGDDNNNAFYDETVTLEITKKAVAIVINDYEFTFGDIIDGNNDTAFANYLGKSLWRMTAVNNGIADGEPFCYDDTMETVIENVILRVYEKNSVTPITFVSDDAINKLFVGISAGEYVIKPTIALKEGNYELSPIVNQTEADFIVNKRKIVIAAENVSKIYGKEDPDYKFRIYDYDTVANAFGGTITTEMFAGDIFEKNLPSIGSKSGINYVSDGTSIYIDNVTEEYHLARDSEDTENVPDTHKIYSGPTDALRNYDVTYAYNNLQIKKSELVIEGSNVNRSYGTIELNYNVNGKDVTDAAFEFYPSPNTPFQHKDTFEKLFRNYFKDDYVFFYNASTNSIAREVVGNYDEWSVLYKNVEFFADEQCSIPVGNRITDFSYEGKDYIGRYAAIPCSAQVGKYYCRILLDANLDNYDAKINEENKYSFVYDITKVKVALNAKSFIVTGSSAIRDNANSPSGRLLSEYFYGEGVETEETDKVEFGAKLDEMFKSNILGVVYTDINGNEIKYRLSMNVLNEQFKFERKNATDFDTGIHEINVKYNDENTTNYDIELTSVYTNAENYSLPYIKHFYNVWTAKYGEFVADTDAYARNAYVVVLPEFTQMGYGSNTTVDDDNPTFIHKELYSAKPLGTFTLNAFYTTDSVAYITAPSSGLSFTVKNKNPLYLTDTMLSAGKYDGTFAYSYFDTASKNYIYLGDTMVLGTADCLQIVKYLFNDKYTGDANNKLKFVQKFDYTVDKVQLATKVVSGTKSYDEKSYVPQIEITKGSICSGDLLNPTFDVEVEYIEQEKKTFSSVGMREYDVVDYGEGFSSGAFNLLYAGTYVLKLVNLGNANYEFVSEQNGEVASTPGTIRIVPINIPVYIKHHKNEDGDEFRIVKQYDITGTPRNAIDTTWKDASSTAEAAFAKYKTIDCYIVKRYKKNVIDDTYIESDLKFVPTNLVITTANEDGSYPTTVKRNAETGEVEGYPVRYRILNSEYINYSVVFVYKSGGNDDNPEFAEMTDKKYEFVIKPKKVNLHNFININSKKYDGNPASVASGLNNINIIGDYTGDKIQINRLIFTFSRPLESTYVGSIESGYQYIKDTANGKAQDNKTDAGLLTVKVRYIDANQNENYEIIFGEEEVRYNGKEGIGKYTIEPGNVILDLQNTSRPFLTRQYDGYGLTNSENTSFTAAGSTLTPENDIIDSLDKMFYRLVVRYYGTKLDKKDEFNAVEASATDDATKVNLNGQICGYDAGYYWYDFLGVFIDAESGKYKSFAEFNPEATDWFSWNYRFVVKENKTISSHGCNGIYHLTKRDVYLAINSVDDENGTLISERDALNAPKSTAKDYTYYITYNGFTYKANVTNGVFDNKYYYDIKSDINALGNENRKFKYSFYVYRNGFFTNINSIENLKTYYDGKIESLTGGFFIGDGEIRDGSDGTLGAGIASFKSAYTNFNFVNAENGVAFRIRAREIGIDISIVNVESGASEMIYGTQFGADGGLYFKFSFTDENYSFVNGEDGYDENLVSIKSVINGIINKSNGRLILEGGINGQSASVNLISSIIDSSIVNGEVIDKSKVIIIDGVVYVKIGQIDKTRFPANKYDGNNQIIDRYTANGTDLESSKDKYAFNVTGKSFRISRRELTITGVERDYFNKDTDTYVFDAFINGVNDLSAEEMKAEVNVILKVLDDNGKKSADYVRDNTRINRSTGTWNALDGRVYYVTIPRIQFKSNDSNYIVKTLTENNELNFSAWDGKSVTTGDYVYLPLTINKAKVKVDYAFASSIKYGDAIGDNDGQILYSGLTALTGGIYTYENHATGELVYEEDVNYVDDDKNKKKLSDEQLDIRMEVKNAILLEAIRLLIAETKARTAGYSVKLYNPATISYVANMDEFENFEIEWGNLTYSVEKKRVELSMNAEKTTFITSDGQQYDYFTAKWSERYDLGYKKSGRLGYNVSIQKFNLYRESGMQTYDNLSEQITTLLGIKPQTENGEIIYEYKGVKHKGIDALMKAICKYEIYDDPISDNVITSGGRIRYVALKGLQSDNFEFVFNRKEIMVYPEIAGIGRHESQGTYANLITDTEASGEGVVVTESELTVKDLSMLVCFNFIGVVDENKLQYIDVKTNKYETSAYAGTAYNRTVKIIYDKDRSTINLDAKGQPSNGDVLLVQILLEETFGFPDDPSVTEIESNFFAVTIKKTGSNKIGYKETELDKAGGATLTSVGVSDTEELDEYLSYQAATYYLSNGQDEYSGKYDIVNLRARLLPIAAGSSMRNFEMTLYENALGKLVLGFAAGTSYVRSEYHHYFVTASEGSSAERFSFNEVLFGEGETGGEEPSEEQYGDAVVPYTYYERVGNSYVLTSDTVFIEGHSYYKKNVNVNGEYVQFVSESVINEDLVDMFDGASHSISVYIDKVGAFDNVNCLIVNRESDYPVGSEEGQGKFYEKTTKVSADRVYTVRVRIDNKSYIFTYNGEPYYYEKYESRIVYNADLGLPDEVNKEVTALQSAQFFGENGKTGIDYNSLRVMIEQYTVQNRLIKTATNYNYIANVIFWPEGETDDDIPYITNEGTLKTLNELISGIGNVTISGGAEAMDAYNAPYNNEKSVISTTFTITDAKGNATSLDDDNLHGMYFYTYKTVYNYGDNLEAILSERTIRVLVTENSVARLSLNGFGADSAAPVTFENEYAFSNDIRDKMSVTNEVTYVFDSVKFDINESDENDKANKIGVVTLYFKLSDMRFIDLLNKNENIENVCSGIALRIERRYENDKWTTKVKLIAATQEIVAGEPFYTPYIGTEQVIDFATDSSVINILKVSVTRVGKEQNTKGVIGENDNLSDAAVAFRLYQHSESGTKLAFEDYIDRSFSSIDQQKIEKDLLNPQSTHYSGIGLTNSSIRMIDFYRGTPVKTNYDFVEYSTKNVGSMVDMPVGMYVNRDTTLKKYAGHDGYSRIYMPTDKYDIPMAYKGNSINFRFSMNTNGEPAPGNRANAIKMYFGMNTPYWVKFGYGIEISGLPLRKQRGLILEYDAVDNKLYFSFYKYSRIYEEQGINLSPKGIALNDGKEHQITAEIDFSNTYARKETYIYTVNLYIDGKDLGTALYIPVGNDLSGLSSKHVDESYTEEIIDMENEIWRDQIFMKGIYYSAVEVLGNVELTLKDIIGFDQQYPKIS